MTKLVGGSVGGGFGIGCIANLLRLTRIVQLGKLGHFGLSIDGESKDRGNMFVAAV